MISESIRLSQERMRKFSKCCESIRNYPESIQNGAERKILVKVLLESIQFPCRVDSEQTIATYKHVKIDSSSLGMTVTRSAIIGDDPKANKVEYAVISTFDKRLVTLTPVSYKPILASDSTLRTKDLQGSTLRTTLEQSAKGSKETPERVSWCGYKVVVVIHPSGRHNFHTGALIDALFAATRSSFRALRFYASFKVYGFRFSLIIHPFQSAELMNLECIVFSRFLLALEDDLAQVRVKIHHPSIEAKVIATTTLFSSVMNPQVHVVWVTLCSYVLMVLIEVKGRFDDALTSLIELGNQVRFRIR
ncbi:hypothetical protein PIB30_004552 [Stylosanthes scabra]|uniref:Uncharacterized protein n=1 Tax=Stylosanthes scabra TaxID=79078 RepID=A0ABU6Y0Z2_9FABA|nr:hypothetical protein [Stylosanthes scabra]